MKYTRERMAELVKKLAHKGFVKPAGIPENPAVIADKPADDSQLMEPMPVMYPASPSPIFAARVHHSSEVVPFLDLNTTMGPYLPPDPIIKGSITGHMNTPAASASATVEVGVAEGFVSGGSSSVPEVKNSRIEAKPPNNQSLQSQPDTISSSTNKAEVIHSLSGTKYAQKGGPKIGQKKGPRPKPGFKKENKTKYTGIPKYAQKSAQKVKGMERKNDIQSSQKVEIGAMDNLKKNENQSKQKSSKTMMPHHTKQHHSKQHKTEQDLKASGRPSHKASFAEMARRMANTKV